MTNHTAHSPRLHLGCGEIYLPGYVNIDYPPDEHTVQTRDLADVHTDLTTLEYEPETVAEVRLHHVFEHFRRPATFRLLLDWYSWLEEGGKVTIETPDFERSAREFVKRRARNRRWLTLRHAFGSHEAGWAVHCDGWYEGKYREVLTAIGFTNLTFQHSEWRNTFNITAIGFKTRPFAERADQLRAVEGLLRKNLVDDSESEQRLLAVWLAEISGDPTT